MRDARAVPPRAPDRTLRWVALAPVVACGPVEESGGTTAFTEPVAVAGPDLQALLGDPFVIDGRLSTGGDPQTLAFTWAFEQVPLASTIDDTALGAANGTPAASTVTFLPDAEGAYVVSLSVADAASTSARDFVVLTVSRGNLPPVADVGPAVTGEVGSVLTLDGGRSFDPDGALVAWDWQLASAPASSVATTESIYRRTSEVAGLAPDVAGPWVLSLRVFDGAAWSAVSWLPIEVLPNDALPVADAGPTRTVSVCVGPTFRLDGSGSYDPEGEPVTSHWDLVSVPLGSTATAADLSDPGARDPEFTWDIPGDYGFTLEVFDGLRWSAKDIVTLTVADPATNTPPIVVVPTDFTVDDTVDCRTELGVTICEVCERLDFVLDAEGTYDPDGDVLTWRWDVEGLDPVTPDNPWTEVYPEPVEAALGPGVSSVHAVTLTVADCLGTSTGTLSVTLTCRGT